jgi:flagellar biogenesis protein FliO
MMTSAVLLRSFASLAIVIGLLLSFVWALRRGMFRTGRFGSRSSMVVETAVSLGERRSLVVVASSFTSCGRRSARRRCRRIK